LILIFILILSTGTASAFNIYDEEIYKGDGYQINNYFIEVFNIISHEDSRLLTINMYQLKSDGTYEELDVKRETNVNNKLTKHKYQSDIVEIIVMEKNCTSTYATVDITTSGVKVVYNQPVKGGLSSAKFIGEPSLLLTKEVITNATSKSPLSLIVLMIRSLLSIKHCLPIIRFAPTPCK